jgi:hypothetical protein
MQMSEKLVVDATTETGQVAEKGVESLVRRAWSVMEAASEKHAPSRYLSDQAMRTIQGKE